jgi:hypothetical protein
MPTIEFHKSRQSKSAGKQTTASRVYKIWDAADDAAAMTSLIATAPSSVTVGAINLTKVEYEIDEEDANSGFYMGSASYSYRDEPGQSQYNFDISTENVHITNSLQTIARYPGTSPNMQGAIGYDGDKIEGCDILNAVYSFSETHQFSDTQISPAYKAALFRAVGKTNNAVFKGFAIGEVLFIGAAGSKKQADDYWELTFRFAASENLSGLSVGTITGIAKKGWEYLWSRYSDKVDTGNNLVRTPQAVYVERVYQAVDFSSIGIGVT